MGRPQIRVGRVFSRREFMSFSALAAASLLAACGGGNLPSPVASTAPQSSALPGAPTAAAAASAAPSTAASTAPAPSAAASGASAAPVGSTQYKEAPILADRVKANTLPPVAQRLPKNPVVVKPVERIGKYGGTWRTSIINPADQVWIDRTTGYENLVRWDPEWKEIVPNVVESYQANATFTEFTFKIREGIRWSDGQPYTSDDVIFWWEDIALDKEVSPTGVPIYMKLGTKNPVVEKVDQYTFKVKYETPNGLFMTQLCTAGSNGFTRHPKHYLQQFHQKYNKTNLDQLVKDNNAQTWVQLFQAKGTAIPGTPNDARYFNKDLPLLHAWILTTNFASGGTRLVAERNPFYFKVDPEGNQLPYLDRVTYEIIADREAMVLKALNGEFDMQDRTIATLPNKPVFVENQQKGQYRFFETIGSGMNTCVITLNLTHNDPVKRQIFQNKDFRIGLSHAINRQEIIDVIYVSQGEPWQAAPRKEAPFFNEKLAKQYTEFDLVKANAALDKAFPQKNAQGLRLGPNGQPISFIVEVTADQTDRVDTLNLVKAMWQKVGVEMNVKPEDRALLYTRKDANEHDAVVWAGDGGLKDVLVEMRYYFPFTFESNFAQAWTAWYNPQGNSRVKAEEPPAEAKKQMELYEQLKATGDEAKQNEVVKQILNIAQEQFYCIGIALPPNGYGIVKNNFRNVPTKMFATGGPYQNPAPTNPCQYFIQ